MTVPEFAQIIQLKTKKNIQFSKATVTGPGHCPTVTVILTVPELGEFEGTGSNSTYAKQAAVEAAIPSAKEFWND